MSEVVPFFELQQYSLKSIFHLLKKESDQLVALILCYLEIELSKKILALFDEGRQSEIKEKIKGIKPAQKDILREVERIMERKLSIGGYESHVQTFPEDGLISLIKVD